ncbi:RNA polymerase sigma factor [Pleomorphovibrio marinus]|uniref:RNA polymerase sigma factor n=1 Tax=Pleomorphovibrio marinus TaxID=2164132 RepID=UPI000E0BF52F|nr:RNA polymerase sigma factor [Pleomorphovibrio marinus]
MEKDLIQKAKNRDPRSLERLYKHFYGYAMSVALRYSGNREEACEIVNDSFMKVFDKIDQFSPENSFKGWLRRILINTSVDYYRKNLKYMMALDIDKADAETYQSNIIEELSREDILGILRELPEILRIIFNMYEIEGYKHDEIAAALNIPSSTSRTYLARAKEKLREKVIALNHIRNEGAVR